ncbi:sigma-70 family RNA polymerase sigma factor [Spirosoma sp. HMF3257]|uniref:RNA polymerase subunit sigma-70 n=1 Tax=Spirosoma telluris TaxID=2183553 RepID=A0A327NFR5_9BACT|nr:sigma-70 family RNA polymerase sigma factor [Spirosoma telluris]RAI73643.1 RNA polymerase subunit sigma-70 [Spirosoma telluris]
MFASLSDEETIRQLLPSQPNQCFEALYSRYVKKVYQRCLSMTKDAEQAEDFTQDIFLKVFNKLDAFQERSSFSTWLYSISYNYCADQLRLSKRLPTTTWEESGIGHNTPDEDETQLQEETLQVVQQAMTTLSVEERTFLRLKYEDGMSIEELALLYNLKPSAVKMRLKRSREKVKKLCVQQCLS